MHDSMVPMLLVDPRVHPAIPVLDVNGGNLTSNLSSLVVCHIQAGECPLACTNRPQVLPVPGFPGQARCPAFQGSAIWLEHHTTGVHEDDHTHSSGHFSAGHSISVTGSSRLQVNAAAWSTETSP